MQFEPLKSWASYKPTINTTHIFKMLKVFFEHKYKYISEDLL